MYILFTGLNLLRIYSEFTFRDFAKRTNLLLQVILEVACDDIVQMHSVCTKHVVLIAWVGEKVWIGIRINAGTHE